MSSSAARPSFTAAEPLVRVGTSGFTDGPQLDREPVLPALHDCGPSPRPRQARDILGDHAISIASVIQHDPGDDAPEQSPVPLVIMTHHAIQAEMQLALSEIDRLDVVHARSICIGSKTEIARFCHSP